MKKNMKRFLLAMVAMVLCLPMFIMQPANATNVTLSLRGQWTQSTDDTTSYKLSCTYGTESFYCGAATGDQNDQNSVWTAGPVLTTGTAIPVATVSLIFSYNVASTPATGSLGFHLYGINGNGASLTPASVTYNYNLGPAMTPLGFTVIKGP